MVLLKELHNGIQKSYEAVLFDLDGTLIDSMWLWPAIDVEYLGRFGIEVPEDLGRSIDGKSYTETAIYFKERFGLKDSIDTIKKTWHEMAHDIYCTRVPAKKGALKFLKFLKEHGIKTAIGTSNSFELAKDVVKAVGIDKYVDTIVTACMVSAGKPKPDIYLKAASDLGVSPEKCLVFEDIPQGIMAGKNAGMTAVAIEDEYSLTLSDEKRELADCYITDFDEFMDKYCTLI